MRRMLTESIPGAIICQIIFKRRIKKFGYFLLIEKVGAFSGSSST